MENNLRFIGITKDCKTAGPGKRLELFLKGCIRGVINPCQGCFNESTWTFEGMYRDLNLDEVAEMIIRDAWNRQVTFCGGEPLLQTRNLAKLCKILKEKDPKFHIVIYTAYKLDTLMKHGLDFTWISRYGKAMYEALESYTTSFKEDRIPWSEFLQSCKFRVANTNEIEMLMQYTDLIVDGDYQEDKRLPTVEYMDEGRFIGSANQRVIDCRKTLQKGSLDFVYADQYNSQRDQEKHCRACGHSVSTFESYCDDQCRGNHYKHITEMPSWATSE